MQLMFSFYVCKFEITAAKVVTYKTIQENNGCKNNMETSLGFYYLSYIGFMHSNGRQLLVTLIIVLPSSIDDKF